MQTLRLVFSGSGVTFVGAESERTRWEMSAEERALLLGDAETLRLDGAQSGAEWKFPFGNRLLLALGPAIKDAIQRHAASRRRTRLLLTFDTVADRELRLASLPWECATLGDRPLIHCDDGYGWEILRCQPELDAERPPSALRMLVLIGGYGSTYALHSIRYVAQMLRASSSRGERSPEIHVAGDAAALANLEDFGYAALRERPVGNARQLLEIVREGWSLIHCFCHTDASSRPDVPTEATRLLFGSFSVSFEELGSSLREAPTELLVLVGCVITHTGVQPLLPGAEQVVGIGYRIEPRLAAQWCQDFYDAAAETKRINAAIARSRRSLVGDLLSTPWAVSHWATKADPPDVPAPRTTVSPPASPMFREEEKSLLDCLDAHRKKTARAVKAGDSRTVLCDLSRRIFGTEKPSAEQLKDHEFDGLFHASYGGIYRQLGCVRDGESTLLELGPNVGEYALTPSHERLHPVRRGSGSYSLTLGSEPIAIHYGPYPRVYLEKRDVRLVVVGSRSTRGTKLTVHARTGNAIAVLTP